MGSKVQCDKSIDSRVIEFGRLISKCLDFTYNAVINPN